MPTLKDGGTNVKVQKIFILKNNMKNIHLQPTSQLSRLVKIYNEVDKKLFELKLDIEVNDNFKEYQNIYITFNEKIKDDEWHLHYYEGKPVISKSHNGDSEYINLKAKDFGYEKIILTTDDQLIADGVQAIDDDFLEWFVKNSSCEYVEVKKFFGFAEDYLIIIPKEEPKQSIQEYEQQGLEKYSYELKQEPLEEVRKIERTELFNSIFSVVKKIPRKNVDEDAMDAPSCAYEIEQLFYKWQQERMYSEEDVIKIVEKSRETGLTAEYLLLTFKSK
jgi:hypothetical protein